MKVVVTAIGTNHFFHMAAQLERRGLLERIFTGYPRGKVKNRGVSAGRIRTFPWYQTLHMARGRFGPHWPWLERGLSHLANETLDRHVAKAVPECDVFIGQSNCSLLTGRRVRSRGGKYICDRPCAHIRVQDRLLREEYARQGLDYRGIDPRSIEREEREYEEADAVLVASTFAYDSFVEMGFAREKLLKIPYGVDTSRFHPTGESRFERFSVLFVGNASLQKGVPDLLQAFESLAIPEKRLVFAGSVSADLSPRLRSLASSGRIEVLGPQPQETIRSLMSRCHVLVLPSIQEGFGMVIAEALACGLPVIASTHTGGPDLLTHGENGYLVPPRRPAEIASLIQALFDDAALRTRLSENALQTVARLSDWSGYGDSLAEACLSLSQPKEPARR